MCIRDSHHPVINNAMMYDIKVTSNRKKDWSLFMTNLFEHPGATAWV
jgi:hypothetical protein